MNHKAPPFSSPSIINISSLNLSSHHHHSNRISLSLSHFESVIGDRLQSPQKKKTLITTKMVKLCELCGAEADLHCAADSAFLCRSCDAKFHASNFLFSRHVRRFICPDCKSLTGDFVSGPVLPWPPRTTCCARSYSSSASSCCSSLDRVSSSELLSTTRKTSRVVVNRARRREKRVKAVADGIFVNWCDELGLNGDSRNAVVSLASLALAVEKPTKKVILAAALWFGVRNSRKTMTWPSLKKVEDVTGVAAGMIRAVESKLARAITLHLRRWRVDSEEGWAENDNV